MRRARIGLTTASGEGTTTRVERVGRGYLDAVVLAGGLPVGLPTLDPSLAEAALAGLDGLLLTGGGDVGPARYGAEPEPETTAVDLARDAWEVELVTVARRAGLPILGICRGAQVLNVAHGGSLVQHLPSRAAVGHEDLDRHGDEVHPIAVVDGSRLHGVLGTTTVRANTIHHQSVDRVGVGLVASARADDGVVEAIESVDGRILGVQWHPELLVDRDPHRELFAWLVAEAAGRGG